MRALLILLSLLLAAVTGAAGRQPGRRPRPWPGREWATATPAEARLDARLLEKARDYALTAEGSGHVIRGGRLVMAWGDPKQRYDLKSSTKSFGSLVLALAIGDGKVRLDDAAAKHHPDFGTPPAENAATGWLPRDYPPEPRDSHRGLRQARRLPAPPVRAGDAVGLQRQRPELAGRVPDAGLRHRTSTG